MYSKLPYANQTWTERSSLDMNGCAPLSNEGTLAVGIWLAGRYQNRPRGFDQKAINVMQPRTTTPIILQYWRKSQEVGKWVARQRSALSQYGPVIHILQRNSCNMFNNFSRLEINLTKPSPAPARSSFTNQNSILKLTLTWFDRCNCLVVNEQPVKPSGSEFTRWSKHVVVALFQWHHIFGISWYWWAATSGRVWYCTEPPTTTTPTPPPPFTTVYFKWNSSFKLIFWCTLFGFNVTV